MIAPEVGIEGKLSVREIIERFNEPFVRERRSAKAYAELCAMSTGGPCGGCRATDTRGTAPWFI